MTEEDDSFKCGCKSCKEKEICKEKIIV